MAQSERAREERQDAKSKARREKLERARSARQHVAFNSIPWPEMLAAIQMVVESGGAIRIGQTRDGGAWAFGLYGLGEPVTLYVNSSDDPFDVIEQIKDTFGGQE